MTVTLRLQASGIWATWRRILVMVAVVVLSATSAQSYGAAGEAGLSKEQYLSGMNQGLDAVERKTRWQRKNRLRFSANLFYAHGGLIPYVPLDVILEYVDALEEAGVDRIDINPGLSPWLNDDEAIIGKYDAVIAHIRARGLELALNPQYTQGDLIVEKFADWERASLQVYAELARRYRPEIFVVVHEPTTMAKRMNLQTTPLQWRRYAQAMARAVKRASPTTRCGAGGLASEKRFFDAFSTAAAIDVLTLDIYGLKDLKTNNEMIGVAKRAGKPVYIEETWRPAYYSPSMGPVDTLEALSATGVGDRDFEDLDARWMQILAAYASVMGLESFTPFWTQTFFAYADPGEPNGALDWSYASQVIAAIETGQRTRSFEVFRELVRHYGRASGL